MPPAGKCFAIYIDVTPAAILINRLVAPGVARIGFWF
jgi:hypothetical protein